MVVPSSGALLREKRIESFDEKTLKLVAGQGPHYLVIIPKLSLEAHETLYTISSP